MGNRKNNESLAYQFGYGSGKSRSGRIVTPLNSFSNPKEQSIDFRRGVRAGKRVKK